MKREFPVSEECMTSPWEGVEDMSTSPVVLKGQLGRSPWATGQHGPHLSSSEDKESCELERRLRFITNRISLVLHI